MGFPEQFELNLNENKEDNFERWLRDYKQELFVYKSHGIKIEKFDMDKAEKKFEEQYGFRFYNSADYIS